ncbi:MAG: dethiobiotin synthase [Acidobacteriota bacterium]
MSVAVIGTDTGVGKTMVCAALLRRLSSTEKPRRSIAYWKPIATGSDEDRDTSTIVELLGGEAAIADGIEILPESYLFRTPVSPHLAARLEGKTIDPVLVVAAFDRHRNAVPGRALIVEGVGGLLVPLTDSGVLFPGLLSAFGLPCVLVARGTLGTINHTLLTLEAARVRGLEIAGVILNGRCEAENRRAIERFGQVEILGELPPIEPLTADSLAVAARSLDPEGHLESLFEP